VQGRSDEQRELLDVESVAGHLLKPGSVFTFLAQHRTRLFPPELFTDLFPSRRGRPSVPPEVVATVLVLQALHGLSDREAVEALTFDLRWKAACGLAITDLAFDPSTLTYWRRRLADSSSPNRIFEVVAEVVAQTGAVTGKTRRALDSTILDDAVARQDTVTQLIAAIRRVAREVPGANEIITGAATSGHDYSRPGKPQIAWDDPAARSWSRRWSTTRWRCWPGSRPATRAARAWSPRRRRRWRCWRWWPARTSNRPRARMAPTVGGASPARSPRTG
jgi:hypothetical protein